MQGRRLNDEFLKDLPEFPKNHILFILSSYLDLSFIRTMTKGCYHPHLGRPSIDPELYFRLVLLSYLFNIKSDRRLCEELRYNIAFRWFCQIGRKQKVPHASSLTKIRQRLGLETFKKVFERILFKCKKIGLTSSRKVFTDSTLVDANASLQSIKERTNNKETQKIKNKMQSQQKIISNATHLSSTDPDSTLTRQTGKARALRYKVHCTIDSESRVILDSKVTTGACHDGIPYLDQIERIKKNLKIDITEAIADRAYGSARILEKLEADGISTNIPLFNGKTGKSKALEQEGFKYVKNIDRYVCPMGQTMVPHRPVAGACNIRYFVKKIYCLKCSKLETCLPHIDLAKRRKHIVRNLSQETYDRVLDQMKTEGFAQNMRHRMWSMEGIFGEGKNNHCLAKAKYRGLINMQIQSIMVACTQNIKRIYKYLLAKLQRGEKCKIL